MKKIKLRKVADRTDLVGQDVKIQDDFLFIDEDAEIYFDGVKRYPKVCELNTKNKNQNHTEIKLKDKNLNRKRINSQRNKRLSMQMNAKIDKQFKDKF